MFNVKVPKLPVVYAFTFLIFPPVLVLCYIVNVSIMLQKKLVKQFYAFVLRIQPCLSFIPK